MAIADRLNKLRTDIEDTYQAINEIGGTIPSDKNTNNIPEAIRSVYDNLPKVSDTGTNVSLSPSLKGRLGIVPKGNTLQDGEPTPDTPVEIQSATGTQKVVVSGKNLFSGDSSINFTKVTTIHLDKPLPAGTYTCSAIITSSDTDGTSNLIQFRSNASGTQNRGLYLERNIRNSATTTITFEANYIAFYSSTSYANSDGDTATIIDMQIEQGSTATPYQPYQEPQEVDIELSSIELNKIGDYEDYIDGTPDNWVLYKILNKMVLKSNMNWQDRPNYSYADRFVCDNVFPTQKRNMLSNYFKVNYATDDTFPYLTDNGTQCTINFSAKGTTTLTEFKNFLDTHNVEVLYPLAETQQTPITEEPLVSQLNELYYLMSYNDTTNIDVTGNLPMRITASAIKGE